MALGTWLHIPQHQHQYGLKLVLYSQTQNIQEGLHLIKLV